MMDLKEFYAQIGGSFDAVLSRLCSESFVRKFVLRYKTDPTFEQLKAAVAVKDWESAFRAAHTLKGVAQNLDFGDLGRSAACPDGSPAGDEALGGLQPVRIGGSSSDRADKRHFRAGKRLNRIS